MANGVITTKMMANYSTIPIESIYRPAEWAQHDYPKNYFILPQNATQAIYATYNNTLHNG